VLLPQALVLAVLTPISGRLYERIGPRWLAVIGLLIVAVNIYRMHQIILDSLRTTRRAPTAAVGAHDRAGDIARPRGSEKRDNLGDLRGFRRAVPSASNSSVPRCKKEPPPRAVSSSRAAIKSNTG
jgi:hypothetical protein